MHRNIVSLFKRFGRRVFQSRTSSSCKPLAATKADNITVDKKLYDNKTLTQKPKILVVCGRNKRRSRTAEYLFKNDNRFDIRSAGLSSKSDVQINEKLINWADLIFVMDNGQRNRINNQYRTIDVPNIENLDIADDYEYLDEELIQMLTTRINGTLKTVYGL